MSKNALWSLMELKGTPISTFNVSKKIMRHCFRKSLIKIKMWDFYKQLEKICNMNKDLKIYVLLSHCWIHLGMLSSKDQFITSRYWKVEEGEHVPDYWAMKTVSRGTCRCILSRRIPLQISTFLSPSAPHTLHSDFLNHKIINPFLLF